MPSAVDMETNPFIIDHDHDSHDGDHDKPPLSDSDSDVDESALHRDYFEKDSRFLDEPALEEGHGHAGHEEELEGYSYPPTSKRARTRQPKLFMFILFCILLAAAAVGILAGHGFKPASTTYSRKGGSKHLTMDHIFNGTFQPHLENIAWVKEGMFVGARCAVVVLIFSTRSRRRDLLYPECGRRHHPPLRRRQLHRTNPRHRLGHPRPQLARL